MAEGEGDFRRQHPKLDDDIRVQVAERYKDLFERVTGEEFTAASNDIPVKDRIEKAIEPFFPR